MERAITDIRFQEDGADKTANVQKVSICNLEFEERVHGCLRTKPYVNKKTKKK